MKLDFLNGKEVAIKIGVSYSKVMRNAKDDIIPSYMIAGKRLFAKTDLEKIQGVLGKNSDIRPEQFKGTRNHEIKKSIDELHGKIDLLLEHMTLPQEHSQQLSNEV